MDLEITTLWCLEWSFNSFSATATGFLIFFFNAFESYTLFKHLTGLACICSSSWPLLSVLHDFTNWPIRFCPLFFTFSNNLWCWTPEEPSQKIFFFLPKKYMSTFPHPVFSPLSRVVYCFLTVSRSVAQNVFNASQGVRDIGFLSWTPLTIFPPQVSCMEEGYIAWLPHSLSSICHSTCPLEPLVTL